MIPHNNLNEQNRKEENTKPWTAPTIQVARMSEAELDLSLQGSDGILFQAS